jgi:hypothetical protein
MRIRLVLNHAIRRLRGASRPSASLTRLFAGVIGATAAVALAHGLVLSSQAAPVEAKISFANQVLPIFEAHCIGCHSPGGVGEISSSMDLSSYKELRMGSIAGVALVPFHADHSPIMRYLKDNWKSNDREALKMPPLGPQLSAGDLKIISDWIDQGAKNN